MRSVVFILFSIFVCLTACAGDFETVVSVLKKQPYSRGASIVEFHGERGSPLPAEWRVLLNDPSARGGVREVTVAGQQITSERTPLRGQVGVADLLAINPSQITQDSDAVFRIAQRESERNEVGFHWIEYTLRTDLDSNAPVWTLKLYDHMGAAVGSFAVSAQSGEIVRSFSADPSAGVATEPPVRDSLEGGVIGSVGRSVKKTGMQAKDETLRFFGTIQEELTGERTIGPKEEE